MAKASTPAHIPAADRAVAPQVEPQTQPTPRSEPDVTVPAEPAVPVAPDPTAEAMPGTDPSNYETVTVKTTGQFNLMDPFSGKHISFDDEGYEVPKTTFIADNLSNGRLVEA